MPDRVSRRTFLATTLLLLPARGMAQDLLQKGRDLLTNVPGTDPSGAGPRSELGQGEIGAGLKEALKVATQRAVGRVGRTNGYNSDPAIRIPLPGVVQSVATPLKSVGAGGALDDLQLKMNRAAEQAAPKALPIFTAAASTMTIGDARSILGGPKDAATSYFRRTTSDKLTQSFRPVVDSTLMSTGSVQAFRIVQDKAATLPMLGQGLGKFSLTDFTVGKSLDGLFYYLGQEEAAIRTDPAARTTALLKKVFG